MDGGHRGSKQVESVYCLASLLAFLPTPFVFFTGVLHPPAILTLSLGHLHACYCLHVEGVPSSLPISIPTSLPRVFPAVAISLPRRSQPHSSSSLRSEPQDSSERVRSHNPGPVHQQILHMLLCVLNTVPEWNPLSAPSIPVTLIHGRGLFFFLLLPPPPCTIAPKCILHSACQALFSSTNTSCHLGSLPRLSSCPLQLSSLVSQLCSRHTGFWLLLKNTEHILPTQPLCLLFPLPQNLMSFSHARTLVRSDLTCRTVPSYLACGMCHPQPTAMSVLCVRLYLYPQ